MVGNIHLYKFFTSMNKILTKSQVGQALLTRRQVLEVVSMASDEDLNNELAATPSRSQLQP